MNNLVKHVLGPLYANLTLPKSIFVKFAKISLAKKRKYSNLTRHFFSKLCTTFQIANLANSYAF